MPELCSAITGLLYSLSHNNTVGAITSQIIQTRKDAGMRVAIDDATRGH